jgi:hypothetical protein
MAQELGTQRKRAVSRSGGVTPPHGEAYATRWRTRTCLAALERRNNDWREAKGAKCAGRSPLLGSMVDCCPIKWREHQEFKKTSPPRLASTTASIYAQLRSHLRTRPQTPPGASIRRSQNMPSHFKPVNSLHARIYSTVLGLYGLDWYTTRLLMDAPLINYPQDLNVPSSL